MPYNFAADIFHTKKLCSRLSSSEVHFFMKIGRYAFFKPLWGTWGQRTTIILALIELFSLSVTAEALRVIIG